MLASLLVLFCAGPRAEKQVESTVPGYSTYPAEVNAIIEAADRGEPQAQSHIGDLYADGMGFPQSYSEAIKWYCRAALQGFMPAKKRLYALGIAGRPGAPETMSLKAICERRLKPLAESGRSGPVGQDTPPKNGGISINIYQGKEATSSDMPMLYGYPRGWGAKKAYPVRPMYKRPPIYIPPK